MSNFTPREKLSKARATLLKEKPFYGSLLMYLDFEENDSVPTLGVEEGGTVVYNPDFMEEQNSEEEVQFLLAHEMLHLAMDTFGREDGHDKIVVNPETGQAVTLWNIATDYANNDILDQEGFQAPESVLLDNRFTDKCADEIYNILDDEIEEKEEVPMACQDAHMKKEGEEGQGSGQGKDKEGEKEGQKAKAEIEKEREERAKKWKSRMAQAHRQANEQQRGEYPGQISEKIGDLMESKLDWRTLLNQYISHELIKDVSFRRPSKKSYSIGAYLPKVNRENLEVTVAIDTSGSIHSQLLNNFMSEVRSILHSYESVKMDLILADAEIQDVHELGYYDRHKVEDIDMVGRGGTDHVPVFNWVDDNKPETDILVALTDGYTRFPDDQPYHDTVWIVPDGSGAQNKEFPFGKVVRVHEDNSS